MPKCINDSSKSYKGNEPSPKGKGFCAHAERVGAIKEGRNEKIWIVKQYSNGQKRWIPYRTTKQQNNNTIQNNNPIKQKGKKNKNQINTRKRTSTTHSSTERKPSQTVKRKKKVSSSTCEHFVFLERKQRKFELRNEYIGKLLDGNQFYEWKKYNCFSDKPQTLRKNILESFHKKKLSPDIINATYCGNKTRVDEIAFDTSLHDKYEKKIFIQHNGYWICLVCLKQNSADVYVIENEDDLIIEQEHYESDWLYTKLISTFSYQKLFEATDTADEYKDDYTINGPGHTILLQNNSHQYTYIGAETYQFKTDDVIEKYYCPEISNRVSYPVAIGTQYAYFLLDHTRVPMKYLHKIDTSQWYLAYNYYYGYKGKKSNTLKKYAIQMKT